MTDMYLATTLSATRPSWQVRIVYFDEALIANDDTAMSDLGLSQYFAEPLVDIPLIKITGEAGGKRGDACRHLSPPLRPTFGQTMMMRRRSVTTCHSTSLWSQSSVVLAAFLAPVSWQNSGWPSPSPHDRNRRLLVAVVHNRVWM